MDLEQRSIFGELASCCHEVSVVQERDGKLQASADFEFPASYVGFSGHFPGRPILPAIVQLAMVRYVSERILGHALYPLNFSRIKFKGMIQPGMRVVVTINLKNHGDGWDCTFALKLQDDLLTGGSIRFTLD